MKKIFIFAILILSIMVINEGFSYMPKTKYFLATTNTNPRGQKRPHDGKGNGKYSGRGMGKNNEKCKNPDKGPGYGQGESRGNGQYRK